MQGDADAEAARRILEGAGIRCEAIPLKVPTTPAGQPQQSSPSGDAQAQTQESSSGQAPTPGSPAAAAAAIAAATPSAPARESDPMAFFAPDSMTLQDVAQRVVAANDGDYLIKANEKNGERVLVIKDSEAKDNVRMYTMKPDGKGRCVVVAAL